MIFLKTNGRNVYIVRAKLENKKRKPLFSHSQNYSLMDNIKSCEKCGTCSSSCSSHICEGCARQTSKQRSSLWVYNSLQNSVVENLVEASASLSINDEWALTSFSIIVANQIKWRICATEKKREHFFMILITAKMI